MLSKEEKEIISSKIKNINISDIEQEMKKLIEIGNSSNTVGPRSRVGNNVVDFFTFKQRLETKGKYDVTFFEFVERIDEFKKYGYDTLIIWEKDFYKNVEGVKKSINSFHLKENL
jgi:very-short-patch-repair endonuclease